LHSFTANTGDGAGPQAYPIDVGGTLWGTTVYGGPGGTGGYGTVYAMNTSGQETFLYAFTGKPDGANPYSELVSDGKGNLYGTTQGGGTHGYGTVFKITTSGQESVLYSFAGAGAGDGAYPYSGLVFDKDGNLYGTTAEGGTHSGGAVFEVTPGGKERTLYSFACGSDGCNPYAHLAYDGNTAFYGTTYTGGTNNYGTVFKITRSGKEKVLYRFQGGNDGENPYGGVTFDSKGDLYGTTRYGGNQGFQNNGGIVFEVTKSGKETILHHFSGNAQNEDYDGINPVAGFCYDGQGHMFGTTVEGGSSDNGGTVFELTL